MCICVAVELLTGPSLGVLTVINWSKFVFWKHCLSRNTIKFGVSTLFNTKQIAHANFNSYQLVQVGLFLDPKLGPINNPYLDQPKTIENGHLLAFCCFKNVLKYLFVVLFEQQPNIAKTWQKITFTICKTQVHKKKHFVATPLLTKNWCFQLVLFETKNIDAEQKS